VPVRSIRSRILPLALLAIWSCASTPSGPQQNPPPGPQPGEFGVLFVGNSLTFWNDMPAMLGRLLETGGVERLHLEVVAFPNFGLEDHWAEGTARARIALGGWEAVVLQQGPSATEGRPSLLEYSDRFAEEIARVGARTALYMVWPDQSRFFDFDGVSDSYSTAAQSVGGLLFPAGEAWRSAWARDGNLALYGPDGFHPSLLGSYLAALVMYEQLADEDPRDLPAEIPSTDGPVGLSQEVANTLQEAAVEANARFALPSRVPR
jgi:hypothetical protein